MVIPCFLCRRDKYFLGKPSSDNVPPAIDRNRNLAFTDVGDDLKDITHPQPHGHQPHSGAGTSADFPNHQTFPGFGQSQWCQAVSVFLAVGADSIQLCLVLKGMKPMPCRNLSLQVLKFLVFEFHNRQTFGADQMVMMMPDMSMFISHMPVLKAVFQCESEMTQQSERFLYEFKGEITSLVGQRVEQITGRHMMLGLQKRVQNLIPVFQTVNVFLMEQLFKLFLFLTMKLFHIDTPGMEIICRSLGSGDVIGRA
jgi:hypothetical protein